MKDLTDSEYADLCDTIKRLRSERNKLRAELATLRATRDADHGAAIEAAAIKLGTQLYGACRGFHETETIRVAMRALVATVMNAQQKGGEEPCETQNAQASAAHKTAETPTPDPLEALLNQSAPEGQLWKCPDCDVFAILGGDAAFHVSHSKHRMPVLVATPFPAVPSARLTKERDHSQLRKEGDVLCPAPAPTTMTPATPIAQSTGASNAAPDYVPSVPVAATSTITFDFKNLRSVIERASPEESGILVIPFLKDSWLALIDAAQERDSIRAELDALRDVAPTSDPEGAATKDMKTITIQIGNSDDKLTQSQWSEFVYAIAVVIAASKAQTHFFACSHGAEKWQNAAWVILADEAEANLIREDVKSIRETFHQDSAAWTEGETKFI